MLRGGGTGAGEDAGREGQGSEQGTVAGTWARGVGRGEGAGGSALLARPDVLAARSRDLPPCPWRGEPERQLSVYIRAGSAGGCDQVQRR